MKGLQMIYRIYTLTNIENTARIDIDICNYNIDVLPWNSCLQDELQRQFALSASQTQLLLATWRISYKEKHNDNKT